VAAATSWVDTRRRYGWPPTAFVVRHRDRVAHELLSSVLAWVGGEVLRLAVQSTGASIDSTSPLSFVTGREQFHVTYAGRVWHLWMEAGGSWQRYGASSLYRSLTTALRAQTRPLAPDLMLILPGEAAFVLECKYSANPDYVGRWTSWCPMPTRARELGSFRRSRRVPLR
jgi:hypothetical protein